MLGTNPVHQPDRSIAWMQRDEAMRVLTVGDGDCSYSLALARAFGDQISLTATTLPDEAEVCSTYSAAAACLAELRSRGARILHGVDATALNRAQLGEYEHICFVHPHLGLSDLLDEAAHARRHPSRRVECAGRTEAARTWVRIHGPESLERPTCCAFPTLHVGVVSI